MSADTGSSFGARGTESSFRPASCGRRSALRWFTSLADQTRFSQASLPPRERGTTWSRLPSSGCRTRPVYWQRLPSRSRMALAQSFGRFFGHLGEVDRHDDRRHPDRAAHGVHRLVLVTDGQRDPLLPGDGTDVFLALNLQAGGHMGGHHAKRLLGRAHVDGLPVAGSAPARSLWSICCS